MTSLPRNPRLSNGWSGSVALGRAGSLRRALLQLGEGAPGHDDQMVRRRRTMASRIVPLASHRLSPRPTRAGAPSAGRRLATGQRPVSLAPPAESPLADPTPGHPSPRYRCRRPPSPGAAACATPVSGPASLAAAAEPVSEPGQPLRPDRRCRTDRTGGRRAARISAGLADRSTRSRWNAAAWSTGRVPAAVSPRNSASCSGKSCAPRSGRARSRGFPTC